MFFPRNVAAAAVGIEENGMQILKQRVRKNFQVPEKFSLSESIYSDDIKM